MYPANYFSLFPPFPIDDRVFVAMSFAPQFEKRWKFVIEPAVRAVLLNGTPWLTPFRVDQRTISDSILTEILSGIARCRLFFADITTIGFLQKTPIRNANVMYEVGIAHAERTPPEVVLFRSDKDPLLFDVSNVRVNEYDPDVEPSAAANKLVNTFVDALKEVNLLKSLSVQRAAARLDLTAFTLLQQAVNGPIEPADGFVQLIAIPKLLEEGLVEATYDKFSAETLQRAPDLQWRNFCRYRLTPFGGSVFNYVMHSTNLVSLIHDLKQKGQTLEQYQQNLRSPSQPIPTPTATLPTLEADVPKPRDP